MSIPRIPDIKDRNQIRIMLILSVIGVILFLFLAATFPFKDHLFQYLFPKPPSHAAITVPDIIDSNLWGTNGYVRAMVVSTDGMYVGGDFTYIGPNTGNGVPLDKTTGERIPNFTKVNRTVKAVISDGNGGWYIGGSFTKVGSLERDWVAHILADGSADANFNANIQGKFNPDIATSSANYGFIGYSDGISSLALSPDKSTLYIGGEWGLRNNFRVGGQTRYNLAAVDAVSGTLKPWAPQVTDGIDQSPYAIVVSPGGSTVYVGGVFSTSSGSTYRYLVAIDGTTGNLLPWNHPIIGTVVRSLTISSDGNYVYAGGSVCTSTACGGAAKIDTTTGTLAWADPLLKTLLNGNVAYALALSSDDSTLYIGGQYTGIIAVDTATGTAKSFNVSLDDPNQNGGDVRALALSPDNTTLYTGGYFTSVGGTTRYNVAAVEANSGTLLPWNPGASDYIYALAVNSTNTAVFTGGEAGSIGNNQVINRSSLAKFKRDGTPDLTFNPSADPNDVIRKLLLSKDKSTLYIGGEFSRMGIQVRNRLAAVEATSGALIAFNPNVTGANGNVPLKQSSVYDMALSPDGNTLYIGGNFTSVGGQARNNLAAIDLITATPTSFNPNPGPNPGGTNIINGHINNMQLTNDAQTLYVSGGFSHIGGRTQGKLAALYTASDSATLWNPVINNGSVDVIELSPDNSKLYITGSFQTINGQTRSSLASFDLTTDNLTDFNPGMWNAGSPCTGGDMAFSCDGKTLFISGEFVTVNTERRYHLAAIDASSSAVLSWDPDITVGTAVSPISIDCTSTCPSSTLDYAVYIGGCFNTVSDQPIQHLAGYTAAVCATPTPTPTPPPAQGGSQSGGSSSGGGSSSDQAPAQTFTPVVPKQGPKTGGDQ